MVMLRDGVIDRSLVTPTLSPTGFSQTRDVMRRNGELGELNHPDLHCLVIRRQLVLTPTFLGAEFESESLFRGERSLGLELVNTLSVDQLATARRYATFADLPRELQGPVDGRHLGGAGQDNRVIPYEGLRATDLTGIQRTLLGRLVQAWIACMPQGPAHARIREIDRHLDDTHFVWYGPIRGYAAFYYRVHSPLVLIEYDNHPGIFLDNDEPEPFHVHTVVRTPNGNDYGRDVLRQHLALHAH